ncbi:MAG: glycosyltransferase [Flavobacteriales bacterium]|nr:glycosyltransferase [Flavobacteriales bacterium]
MERDLRIVLASPAENAWSETFIAAHIERLKKVDLLLSGGVPPRNASHGGPLGASTGIGKWVDRVMARPFGGVPELLRHRLARRLGKERPDVVLAEYGTMAAEIVDACRSAGVPLVAHFHGFDAHRTDYIARYDGYRDLFAHASALVVVSRAMEQQLISIGAPREKVIYNCYGIDVDRFVPGDAEAAPPHFLAVGRFADKKAPHLTLRAFRTVLDQRPEARLTMVGKGKRWDECNTLVTELGMARSVDLCGIRTPDEIVALMQKSRAFVQHSVVTQDNDHEGTPLAVLEAMASAVPVIATHHAGIADVVEHGVRGLLGAEQDTDVMAANMVRVIDDPVAAKRMGTAGRAYVEVHHRVEVQVEALQRILRSAARSAPR